MREGFINGTVVPLLKLGRKKFETLLDTAPSGHYLAIFHIHPVMFAWA